MPAPYVIFPINDKTKNNNANPVTSQMKYWNRYVRKLTIARFVPVILNDLRNPCPDLSIGLPVL